MFNIKNSQKGFSLIELLVATAIFTIVMTVAVGSLITMIDANRKAQALKSVMNNLNFALEGMVRSARVGSTYHCENDMSPSGVDSPSDCSSGGVLFAFEAYGGNRSDPSDQIIYRFNSGNNQLERSTNGGADFIAVTAPEVTIENMRFYVIGAVPLTGGDDRQPRVVITIRGRAGQTEKTETTFELQGMASQRVFDI